MDEPPPCGSCRPELNPCNAPYFELFGYCQDQMIMGPSGPISLNMLSVNQAMTDYDVDPSERRDFSFKVRKIACTIFSEQASKAAEDSKSKK